MHAYQPVFLVFPCVFSGGNGKSLPMDIKIGTGPPMCSHSANTNDVLSAITSRVEQQQKNLPAANFTI